MLLFLGGCDTSQTSGPDYADGIRHNEPISKTVAVNGATRIDATTTNGSIVLDGTAVDQVVVQAQFAIHRPDGSPQNLLVCALGNGGDTPVVLSTTHGDIRLKKR